MIAVPVVIADTREQLVLRFSGGVMVERATLPTGDYSLRGFTDFVAIERKTIHDLVRCVGPERPRFMDCCRRLQAYELRAIVVEASLDDVLAHAYGSATHPQSVIGTVLALHVDYAVPTIWAGNANNAANIVERMLVRVWRKRLERREELT